MTRATAALAILLLPALALSLLLALGERDWYHCFLLARPATFAGLLAQDEALSVLLQSLTAPTASASALLAHVGPTALFALLYRRAATAAARRILLVALALYLGLIALHLLPPSAQHACTAAGPDPALSRFLFAGTLAALLANKITCLTETCRP